MKFGFNLNFDNLNNLDSLKHLDQVFLNYCGQDNYKTLLAFRANPSVVPEKEYSNLIIKIAPLFDDFLAELFPIGKEVSQVRAQSKQFDIIYECKRKFVQRFAIKKYPKEKLQEIDFTACCKKLKLLFNQVITQEIFAEKVLNWLLEEDKYIEYLDLAAQYAAFMVHNDSHSALFNLPEKIDPHNLISQKKIRKYKDTSRVGFNYCDSELHSDKAIDHSHYCIYCHNQGKDSCSKGLALPAPAPFSLTEGDNKLPGCPLKQKISEMNYLRSKGFVLAALATIVIDNPMVAATGHRICNDCMKACIFQKQEPVNIPLIESNILTTVLELPYGLEIYLLLTCWNPLNIYSPLPKLQTGYNVLVVGLGPAGFSLAHYLLNEGHNVVAIDGLRISPLPFDIKTPIKYWDDYKKQLSERIPQGFGGVAEYGITSRWDKNNLTIIQLILERRNNFKFYDGIRLGSNLTTEQVFEIGFDHIAMCTGAGPPKILKDKPFVKGMRTAADFLMTLQSNGAFLKNGMTNLTIRMPIAIIGCGLTALDAATEALNYYPLQVEKFLAHYEILLAQFGAQKLEQYWSAEDKIIAEEFIAHAQLFRKQKDNNSIKEILEELGGATIYYRGNLQDSAAYRLNHEEVIHTIAKGVKFAENMTPLKFNVDNYEYIESIEFSNGLIAPVKTVLIAIGIDNNNIPFSIDNNRYSYFGDCNPLHSGSVVKAIASSKEGYPLISKELMKSQPNFLSSYRDFFSKLDYICKSRIEKVNILGDNIVELIIHSPLAARNFKPGQFFRLQNYSNDPQRLMEPLALTGADVNYEKGLIHLIILETGWSSNLCRYLSPGDNVAFMGPTGTPTRLLKNANIMLIGGGLGNAVLFSIAKALKENGCKVTYIAGYKKIKDRFYQEKIENSTDTVIWCCEEGKLSKNREEDISIVGNVVEALRIVAATPSPQQIICIGSSQMMETVKEVKNELFGSQCELICSINSPMQCMMKGICGQCVQQVLDERGYIFTCDCQDQNAEIIDFNNLKNRLEQNSLQEKLMALYMDKLAR